MLKHRSYAQSHAEREIVVAGLNCVSPNWELHFQIQGFACSHGFVFEQNIEVFQVHIGSKTRIGEKTAVHRLGNQITRGIFAR